MVTIQGKIVMMIFEVIIRIVRLIIIVMIMINSALSISLLNDKSTNDNNGNNRE